MVKTITASPDTSVNWGFTTSTSGNGPEYMTDSGLYNVGTSQWSTTTFQPYFIEAQVVPEPGTLALFTLAALAGVGGWCFQRKRRPVLC